MVAQRQHLKTLESDSKRKDDLIRRLVDELKQASMPVNDFGKRKVSSVTVSDFKRRIRDLKADLSLKEVDLINIRREVRFIKITDLENALEASGQEIENLKHLLEQEQ